MSDFWSDLPGVKREMERVRELVDEEILRGGTLIREAVRPLALANGKMLRPALLCLSARFGPRYEEAKTLKLAASLELLHLATLVHDDVIDDSPLRRGLPTAYSLCGSKDAVLAGDYLLSRSFSLAADYATPGSARLLTFAVGALCRAELDQDASRFKVARSPRLYLKRIIGKTSVLFMLACSVGAREFGAGRRTQQRLRRAGYDMGTAFQIIDDVLDYVGDSALLHKPIGEDLRQGVCTLPLILALASDVDCKLAALLGEGPGMTTEADAILRETIRLKGPDCAMELARLYTNRALREISALPPGEAREAMFAVAKKLAERRA